MLNNFIMLQFLIPGIVVLLAIIIIAIIVMRHFPQAAAIDVESLPAEKEAAMKAALMERRFKRKILEFKNKFQPLFRKLGQGLQLFWKKLHARVAQLEQRYRTKSDVMSSEQQQDVKQKIKQLISEAEKFGDQENFSDAEEKYIEVLSWDPKNMDAFFGLASVYFEQKNYDQAQATFLHLLRLASAQKLGEEKLSKFSTPVNETKINEAHFDYAICLQRLEKVKDAIEEVKQLLERDSNNPKYLDKMVELSIVLKNRTEAFKAWHKLKEVNPENQKLASFEEQIMALPF